jgi:hypothetical protein
MTMPQTISSAGKVLPLSGVGVGAREVLGAGLASCGSGEEAREKKLSRMRFVILANVALKMSFPGCGAGCGTSEPAGTRPRVDGCVTEVRGGGEIATFTPVLSA